MLKLLLKIKNKVIKEIKFFIKKIISKFINNSELNLGDSKVSLINYYSAGLNSNADIYLDITKRSYSWMLSKYKFIWSERLLEHIKYSDINKALLNIQKLLEINGRCRMCLPICFYGTNEINMLRKGNYLNCFNQGHFTWFTFYGLGPVNLECFGASKPPNNLGISWSEFLKNTSLKFLPIRYYNTNSSLWINKEIMNEVDGNFYDRPEIIIKRKDSLIFDLVKIN